MGIALHLAIGQTDSAKDFLGKALSEATGIPGVNLDNINITITGHSLGGYLAQQEFNLFRKGV